MLGVLVHDDSENPMDVWRVQDAAGRGPYVLQGRQLVLRPEIDKVIEELSTDERVAYFTEAARRSQPVPQKDFFEWVSYTPDSMYYGFEKPADAQKWFGKRGLAVLAKAGFTLVKVPAKKVYTSISRKQVRFQPAEQSVSGTFGGFGRGWRR